MSFELEEGSTASGTLAANVNSEDCGIFYGCTDPAASNYDDMNTIDDGSCIYTCDEEGFESVTLVCDGGLYQYQVAWNIEDAHGNIIFSAGDDD